jgi:hypothetical protein
MLLKRRMKCRMRYKIANYYKWARGVMKLYGQVMEV